MTTTTNTNALVSIVMCTYNGSAFLTEQIESLLKQDYRPLEIVVVDDCSTDDTWQQLQRWETSYPNIFRIFQNEYNLGYNKNFERGIQLARGEYIALSDQDDIWMPTKISASVRALEAATDNSVLVYCKNVVFENGVERHSHVRLMKHFEGDNVKKMFLKPTIAGHTMLFKQSLIPYILPIPSILIYDWWVAINAGCNGGIIFLNQVLVKHRQHANNAAKGSIGIKIRSQFKNIEEVLPIFLQIESMNANHKYFLNKLITLFVKHNTKSSGTIDWQLFVFFLANRKTIFYHKKRFFPLISQIKHSLRISRMYPLTYDLGL